MRGMLLGIFFLLFFLASGAAQSAVVNIHGQVDRFFNGPDGKPEGLILRDHSVLKFSPLAVVDTRLLGPGDGVFARGDEIVKRPNRVLAHVLLKKGSEIVTDETRSHPPIPQVESPVTEAEMVYRFGYDTSPLLAVSARDDGEINRLILTDGMVVRVPREGFVAPNRLKLGSKIFVQGITAGVSGPPALQPKFIHATDVEGPREQSLLKVKGPGEWASKEVKIKQLLITPNGEADGALLVNNSAIRFDPLPAYQVADLKPGAEVRIAGRQIRNQLHAGLVFLTEQRKLLEFGRMRRVTQAAGIAVAPQVSPVPGALAPIRENSTVEAVLRLPGGGIDALVLADGAVVRAGRLNLKEIAPGDRVAVSGFGGHYVQGTAIDADAIIQTS